MPSGNDGKIFLFYPPDVPNPDQSPPFFRKKQVELIERSSEQLEEDWEAIRTDVEVLLDTLERNHTLSVSQTYHITG